MAWVSLCELGVLVEGRGKYVEIEGYQLAVFLDGGEAYVIDNRCPHAGGSLAVGDVEDGRAVCRWHQWAFGLKSGELKGRPLVRIRTYRTRLLDRAGKTVLVQAELPTY
ncbi:MAG: Rieske (2Fe-2S) protein [Planctomycetota bacterium]|nr:Rieske (2Fe-2S) protein [Planctomycetota bacterium]